MHTHFSVFHSSHIVSHSVSVITHSETFYSKSAELLFANAILETFPAVLQCLSSINTSVAVDLHIKRTRFSIVYRLIMFKIFLPVNEEAVQISAEWNSRSSWSLVVEQWVTSTLQRSWKEICFYLALSGWLLRWISVFHLLMASNPDSDSRQITTMLV